MTVQIDAAHFKMPVLGAPAAINPSVENNSICIASIDEGMRIVEATTDFMRQFGRRPDEVHGADFADFVHPSVRLMVMQQMGKLVEGKRDRFSIRLIGLTPGNTVFSAALTSIAVRNRGTAVKTIILILRPDARADGTSSSHDHKNVLSELDARVLEGVAAGVSTVQLAARLYLSRQGVEYHVGAMLRRFKVPNRAALAAKAYAQGILTIGQWPPKVLPDYIRS